MKKLLFSIFLSLIVGGWSSVNAQTDTIKACFTNMSCVPTGGRWIWNQQVQIGDTSSATLVGNINDYDVPWCASFGCCDSASLNGYSISRHTITVDSSYRIHLTGGLSGGSYFTDGLIIIPNNWEIDSVTNTSNNPSTFSYDSINGNIFSFQSGITYNGCVCSDCGRADLDIYIKIASVSHTPIASFQASDTTICANDYVNFTNLSANATSCQWNFQGATPDTSTAQNPQNIFYLTAGTYNVTLIASNSNGSDSLTFTNYIKVNPAPSTPTITQSHDTLYCSTDSSYISYQWYIDSNLIIGATYNYLVITHNGNYNLDVTNTNDCSIAAGININTGINEFSPNNYTSLFPNPAIDQVTIHTSSFHNEAVMVSVVDVLGQIASPPTPLSRNTAGQAQRGEDATIDVSRLTAGMYFLEMKSESGSVVKRFVKE